MKENKRNWIKHIFALLLFCITLNVGMISFADGQGTVKVPSAVIRASADGGSERIGSVKQGKTVDIAGQTTGTDGKVWYQVYVDSNTKGYIRGDLLDVKDASAINTIQGSASSSSSSNSSTTTATPVEAKKVTVKDNGRRIRSGASTNHDIVATVNKGMVLTVTGEAQGSDGKWYQVSFNHNDKEVTGFIRADLVTTDNVPADTATSQITGEQNPGRRRPRQSQWRNRRWRNRQHSQSQYRIQLQLWILTRNRLIYCQDLSWRPLRLVRIRAARDILTEHSFCSMDGDRMVRKVGFSATNRKMFIRDMFTLHRV